MTLLFVLTTEDQIALGTPNEIYDAEVASRMLASAGEAAVKVAIADLLERGMISKVVRDPTKSKPGRLMKISEVLVIHLSSR